eukprot:704590-Rhodomonas_salina.1
MFRPSRASPCTAGSSRSDVSHRFSPRFMVQTSVWPMLDNVLGRERVLNWGSCPRKASPGWAALPNTRGEG